MRARLLQRARPADVAALVEARLQLHQADRLLAALGRLDQRRHQRRVVGGAVHGHLDREHVGVAHGLLARSARRSPANESYGWCTSRSPRAHRREHVRACRRPCRANAGWHHRRPGRVAQLAVAVDVVERPQVLQVEQARRRRSPAISSIASCSTRYSRMSGSIVERHLEPHHLAEAPAAQLVLHGAQQVVGLVGDREVGVARDPEEVVAQDLHAREELARGGARSPTRAARTRRRRSARSAAAPPSAPSRARRSRAPTPGRAARHAIDSDRFEMYGKGRPGPTASGVSTGKICSANSRSIASSSSASSTRHVDHPDAVLGERGAHARPPTARECRRAQLARALGRCARASRAGESPSAPARVDAGVHLVVQAGHAHHEELVEVGRVDREELHALEQRRALVLGQLEHALVELEPGQLAVRRRARASRASGPRRCVAVTASIASSIMVTRPCSGCCAMGTPPTDRPTRSAR